MNKKKNQITFQKMMGHLKTILHHKRLVREGCFKAGIYWQGITHDLSKFSPTNFGSVQDIFRAIEVLIMHREKILVYPRPGYITREETSIILSIGLIIP